jgi:transposase
MDVVYRRCAGLDVHKQSISALRNDFKECGVTQVVMESTGVYWLPVWGLLEGTFALMLVNPQHFRAVPGRKTDQKTANG